MELGRSVFIAGLVIAAVGLLLMLAERSPIRLGHLPGDIVWRGRGTTVYFPIVTCLLLSLVFSILTWLFNRR